MCIYCERRTDVKFGWEQPKLPYHDQTDISANLSGNVLENEEWDGVIHDYQTACPELILTRPGYFNGEGVGTIYIPIKHCPECGRKLGRKSKAGNQDLKEQKVKSEGTFLIPVQVGGFIWDKYDPNTPKVVLGYRIGRMMGEDEEDYEEDFPNLEWYIQYGHGGTECSVPISEIGVSIFLSQKEAIAATQHN